MLLVRPHIVQIPQSCSWAADKAAALFLKYAQHALHHRRVEQHIVIEKMNIRRGTLLKQEVTLLCEAASWQVSMQHHLMSMPAQGAHQGCDFDALQVHIVIFGLIRDNDVEIGKGLP